MCIRDRPEADAPKNNDGAVQLDLFTDYAAEEEKRKAEDAASVSYTHLDVYKRQL